MQRGSGSSWRKVQVGEDGFLAVLCLELKHWTVLNNILLQIAYRKCIKHLCDGRLMLNKLLI